MGQEEDEKKNDAETKQISETSVLAQNFVPSNLRSVNHATVTTPWEAQSLPTLDLQLRVLFKALIPYAPGITCFCGHCADKEVQPYSNNLKIHQRMHNLTVDSAATLQEYVAALDKIVRLEHLELQQLYKKYDQFNTLVGVVRTPLHNMAWVEVLGIADARPALYPGDTVLVRPLRPVALLDPKNPNAWSEPHHVLEITAQVIRVSRVEGTISFTWMADQLLDFLSTTYPLSRYNLQFVPSTKRLVCCLTAFKWLRDLSQEKHWKVARELLFPNKAPTLPPPTNTKRRDDYEDLNDEQQSFVDMILQRTDHPTMNDIRAPIVLTGPAGTGKTLCLLSAILHVLEQDPNTRVLVCAPSHTAADVVTRRLVRFINKSNDTTKSHMRLDQIFRLYDSDRPVATVPVSLLSFCKQSPQTGTFCLPTPLEIMNYRVVVCTCYDASLLYRAGLTNAKLRSRKECFRKSITTVMAACHLEGTITGVDRPHFTHLFLDEAAQATEPEVLISLSIVVDPRPKSAKAEIVLVGDPRQLSPNVYSKRAAESGLGRSFLERLLQRPVNCLGGGRPDMLGPEHYTESFKQSYLQQPQLSVFLTKNYRGHSSFLMMPSALFYFDKLQSASILDENDCDLWCERLRELEALTKPVQLDHDVDRSTLPESLKVTKRKDWPIMFWGVIGQDASMTVESFASSSSWSNRVEAELVVSVATTLMSTGVNTDSIGIMAPFRGQVVLIRQLLRESEMSGINVGTIEDFQAVERDVTILSLTRSNPKFISHDVERRVGVFHQAKRTNVALTRAEQLLIVVGNPDTMWTDPIWRQWLLFAYRSGRWYGEAGDLKSKIERMAKASIKIVSHRVSQFFPIVNGMNESKQEENQIVIGTMELRSRR